MYYRITQDGAEVLRSGDNEDPCAFGVIYRNLTGANDLRHFDSRETQEEAYAKYLQWMRSHLDFSKLDPTRLVLETVEPTRADILAAAEAKQRQADKHTAERILSQKRDAAPAPCSMFEDFTLTDAKGNRSLF